MAHRLGRFSDGAAMMVAIGALTALTSCGDGKSSANRAGSQIRAEAACDVEGLTKPLRQTLILVDARAISKVADGAEFASKNVAFRDIVLGIADPAKALPAGVTAARERVIIAVVPSDGSAAQVAFTGCVPGMSQDELAAATRSRSAVDTVFSSGPAGKLEDQAEDFRKQLIGGMVAAAGKADGTPSAQSGSIEESSFLAGLRASKGLLDIDGTTQRLVLYSDLAGLTAPATPEPLSTATPSAAPPPQHKAGLDAGIKAGGNFHQVDLHIILPQGRAPTNGDFLDGYFLAQGARLASYAAGGLSNTTPPPTRLWTFAAQVAYPSGQQLAEIRIGDDGKGKLAGAWLTLLGDPVEPIPMFGQIVCTATDNCQIVSDKTGFAQAWSATPGGAPEFDNKMPFAGMRNFKFQISGQRLTGEAFDDDVYLGADTKRHAIAITAQAK